MSRLDELRWLYAEAKSNLDRVPADRTPALIGQMRGLLEEIQELEADLPADSPRNPLDELREKRAARSA